MVWVFLSLVCEKEIKLAAPKFGVQTYSSLYGKSTEKDQCELSDRLAFSVSVAVWESYLKWGYEVFMLRDTKYNIIYQIGSVLMNLALSNLTEVAQDGLNDEGA